MALQDLPHYERWPRRVLEVRVFARGVRGMIVRPYFARKRRALGMFHPGDLVFAGRSPHIGRIIRADTIMDRYTVRFFAAGGTDVYAKADLRRAT